MRYLLLGLMFAGYTLVMTSCKTTDRWLGRGKQADHDKTPASAEEQEYAAQAQFCEQQEKRLWHRDLKRCLTAQDFCIAKQDGSLWINDSCLSLEQQCLLNDGQWEDKQCKSPPQLCQDQPGYIWRYSRCLSAKEACLSQDKSYRYQWQGGSETNGACKIKGFLDYCQAGAAAPSDVQYTVNILKRLAGGGGSCAATHQWLSETIAASHRLELYSLDDSIQIKDLAPLMTYVDLYELILTNNIVSDLTPLAELKNLRILDLQHNQIESLDGLQGLVNLQTLYLGHNRITNLAPLQKLTGLLKLHLHDNRLNDISPLAGLTQLEVLHLKTNAISNLAPLRNLLQLRELELQQNPIMSSQVTKTPTNCPFSDGVSAKLAEICRKLQSQ